MDKVKFNKKKHTYTLIKDSGEKIELTSVTTLLKKHGITPDYSNVNESVLKAKAERGSVIHEELEQYINHKQVGFTSELENFIKACKKHDILPSKSEFMVWNEEIAGTVDVAGLIKGQTFLGDFKTTVTLHREAVAWQLSLYAYLLNEEFDKFLCIHFPDENTCNVVEIQPIEKEEIERLLECERNCELFQKKTLELDTVSCEKIMTIQQELKTLDDRKKELEKVESELKQMLIEKMEETGVKSIDNDYFKITYIAPGTRDTIDSARIKKELPEIAEKYTKTTAIKASVRITLKD